MQQIISKSQFKAQLLEYLRKVEQNKQSLIVTHAGKPVVKVTPYHQDEASLLKSLRDSVIAYKDPTKPALDKAEWEALK